MYLANLAVTDERRENMLNIMKKANAMLNKVFTGLSVVLLAVVIVATALSGLYQIYYECILIWNRRSSQIRICMDEYDGSQPVCQKPWTCSRLRFE